jgi:nitroreductase
MTEPQTPPAAAAGMTAAEAIASRRSIRGFLPRPVPRARLEAILALAARAPSGSNIQPWKLHAVTGPALARLGAALRAAHEAGMPAEREYEYYPTRWRDPYLARRRRVGWQLYALAGVARGDREGGLRQQGRNFDFFGAPVGLVFTIDADLEQGSWLDYGMFLQTVMIAARAEGLDTCPQAAIASYPAILRRELGIPPEQTVVCGMALGWADPAEPANALVSEREPVAGFTTFHEA